MSLLKLCHPSLLRPEEQEVPNISAAIPTWLKLSAILVLLLASRVASIADEPSEKTWKLTGALTALDDSYPGVKVLALNEIQQLKATQAKGLVAKELDSSDLLVRRAAIQALARAGTKDQAQVIVPLLKDADFEVRSSAAEALGELGATEQASALVPLLKDSHSSVRRIATYALGKLGARDHAAAIVALLRDPESRVRDMAAFALGEMGAKDQVPAIVALLKDTDLDVRSSAADALGELGAKEQASALVPLLNDPVSGVWGYPAKSAAGALIQLGAKDQVPAMVPLLKDASWAVRSRVAYVLGELGAKDQVPAIVPLLKDTDGTVRNRAAEALGKLEAKDQAPAILPLLNDPQCRGTAAEALGRLGAKDQSSAIVALLKDEKVEVSGAARKALAKLGAKDQIPAIVRLLEDPAPLTRRTAVDALVELGAKDQALAIIPLLKDEYSELRQWAANALATLAAKEQAAAIVPLLKDADRSVRLVAAGALGKLGAKEQAPAIIALLKDTDSHARGNAAYALGELGLKDQAAAIVPLLKDADPEVRSSAAKALGKLAAKDHVPALVSLLKDTVSNVRRGAADALVDLVAKDQASALVPLLDDPDSEVRKRVANALRDLGPVGSFDVFVLIEETYNSKYATPSLRWEACFYSGGRKDVKSILMWLGRPADEPRLPSDREEALQVLSIFENAWPYTLQTPLLRQDLSKRIAEVIASPKNWTPDDISDLTRHRDNLNSVDSNYGPAVDKVISHLQQHRQRVEWSKRVVWVVSAHIAFWAALVFLYPRYRWVQAIFFWNPWVRRIAGLGYVPWVITFVPYLRRRLLRPFQANLIPDRFQHEFQRDSYFARSRITSSRGGHTVTRSANEYLKPPLRGPRVIEAPSGCGKTTLLQWFVQQPGNPRVVLRATECDQGVMKAIQQCVQGIARDEAFLQTLVYSGGLDVIIDGLNEATPETRGQIGTFVNDLFRGNYLLTTQPLLGYKIPRAAELWKLQPLATNQIPMFLIRQWRRVETTAAAHRVSKAQYKAAVRKLLDGVDPETETERFTLSTPLDAALVADLIAQNIEPDLNNLIAQHVRLARDSFREIAPAQEPAFSRVGEKALELVRGQKPKLDLVGLERECDALITRKLLISHGTEYFFRHDRIRDYFIALSIPGVDQALQLRHDPRSSGVFEFLPETLDKTDADELGEILKKEAADTADNRVWSKYKLRWDQPGRFERIEDLIRVATTHYHAKKPGQTPNFVAIGERATDEIQSSVLPNWNSLEAEVDGLVAARVMLQSSAPNEPARFRTEDIRRYFAALYLASTKLLSRAKELSTDDRIAGLFEFLPRLLDKPERDELGKYLEKASNDAKKAGKSLYLAWEQYRKNWRRRKPANT
jgi:HEAT repeat protein